MYFWNVKRLKQDLATGPLGSKASIQYVVAYTLLYQIPYIAGVSGRGATWAPWITSVATGLGLVVNILGLIYCYRMNGGPGGRYFLDRFVSLSWVMSMRLITWMILATVVLVAVMVATHSPSNSSVFLPFIGAVIAFWWWRLGRHIYDVAIAAKERMAPDAPAKADILA